MWKGHTLIKTGAFTFCVCMLCGSLHSFMKKTEAGIATVGSWKLLPPLLIFRDVVKRWYRPPDSHPLTHPFLSFENFKNRLWLLRSFFLIYTDAVKDQGPVKLRFDVRSCDSMLISLRRSTKVFMAVQICTSSQSHCLFFLFSLYLFSQFVFLYVVLFIAVSWSISQRSVCFLFVPWVS